MSRPSVPPHPNKSPIKKKKAIYKTPPKPPVPGRFTFLTKWKIKNVKKRILKYGIPAIKNDFINDFLPFPHIYGWNYGWNFYMMFFIAILIYLYGFFIGF